MSNYSGYLGNEAETFSPLFTALSLVHTSTYSTLWKACRYGRWHALKGLNPENSNSTLCRQMLHKEFAILIQMQHPHVVQAMSIEEVAGVGECIVMEWVDGVTLSEWLAPGRSDEERRRAASELLSALAYVHSMGVVHRDLKPENIMVTHNGSSVKLIDFSLADTASYAVLKQPGGTPGYMAHEQMVGKHCDVRNDIYSLGMVLKEMEPPRNYYKIVDRCLLPIGERYENMDALMRDFHSIEQKGRGSKGGLLVNVVIQTALLAALAFLLLERKADKSRPDSVPTAFPAAEPPDTVAEHGASLPLPQIDSLRQELAQKNRLIEQYASEHQQAAPADQAIDENRRQLDYAIAVGKKKVDESANHWQVNQMLDTLTRWEYRSRFLTVYAQNVSKDVYDYLDAIAPLYSKEDMAQIRAAVLDYWSSWNEGVSKKMRRLMATQ